MRDEIINRSATDLARAIRSGELSSVEVVTAHLDRIDEVNPQVNAIVAARPRADVLADAAAADAADRHGPLHGLPVAVKDLEDVEGLPTRSGSTVTSDRPKQADGHVAAQLRRAGAVIVGKTNTPEFGTGSHTFNEVHGLTRNPWNLGRSAGGSSGGAAAALAARMLPIADGSDFGGSLRNPAAFCNVVGLRPSIGRVAEPAVRSAHLLRLGVRGPMGRTVGDTALLLSALAGHHPADPISLRDDPTVFSRPLPATTDARIAWAGDLDLFTCEPEVLELCEAAARRVADVGGSCSAARPDLTGSMTVFRTLRGMSYRDLGSRLPDEAFDHLKGTVQENITYGRGLDAEDVLAAEISRAELHRRMTSFWRDHDVLALPAAQVAPFPADQEFPTEIDGVAMRDYLDWMTTCCVITPTGCPTISIPAGFTNAGLPVGLQLVAPFGHERRLLEIAAAMESRELTALIPPIAS
ncbi:MAG: amidase [Actinomycetota bacterium]